MEKIRVDFNRRNGNGELITSMRRSTGELEPGDLVLAYQPGEEDMDSTGEVVAVEDDGRVVIALLEDISFNLHSSAGGFWVVRQQANAPAVATPSGIPTASSGASHSSSGTPALDTTSHRDRELVLR